MSDILHTIRLVTSAAAAIAEVQKYKGAIVGATQTIEKHANTLSGGKVLKNANEWTAAVARLGGATGNLATNEQLLAGASKLTAAEKAKLNTTITEAITKYQALGQQAPAAMTALANATKATTTQSGFFAKTWSEIGTTVKGTLLGFVSGQAIIGAFTGGFRALMGFVSDSVVSFAAAEAANKKLTTALQAQGTAIPQTAKQYQALGTQFQRTTAFSDDLVTEMQALLVQVGDVMPNQMGAALTAATDLSAGLGIDLRQATMLVGKAFAGETGTLKRYGIAIDEAKFKTEGATVVMDAIAEKFGGQAQAQLDTYAGKLEHMANSWDNVKEAIGGSIVTSPIVINLLDQLSAAVLKVDESSGQATLSLANLAETLHLPVDPTVIAFLESYADHLNEINKAYGRMADTARKNLPPLMNPPLGPAPGSVEALADFNAGLDATIKAQKEAEPAAKAHAKALASLRMELSGAGVIAKAQDYLVVVQQLGGATTLTAAAQQKLNQALFDAIQTGRATQAMKDLWLATLPLVPLYQGLGNILPGVAIGFDKLVASVEDLQAVSGVPTFFDTLPGKAVGVEQALYGVAGAIQTVQQMTATLPVTMADVASPSAWQGIVDGAQTALNQLPGIIVGAIQGGGNVGKAAGSFLGGEIGKSISNAAGKWLSSTLGTTLGGIVGSTIPIIGSLIGSLLGGLLDKIGGPSKTELAGRSAADQFRQQLIGLMTEADKVEAQTLIMAGANATWANSTVAVKNAYIAAGHSGEEALAAMDALFKAEKQGPEAVAAAIAAINKVLGEQTVAIDDATVAADAQTDAVEDTAAAGELVGEEIVAAADSGRVSMEDLTNQGIIPVTAAFQDTQVSATHAFSAIIGGANSAIGPLKEVAQLVTTIAEGSSPGGWRGVWERTHQARDEMHAYTRDGLSRMRAYKLEVDGVEAAMARHRGRGDLGYRDGRLGRGDRGVRDGRGGEVSLGGSGGDAFTFNITVNGVDPTNAGQVKAVFRDVTGQVIADLRDNTHGARTKMKQQLGLPTR